MSDDEESGADEDNESEISFTNNPIEDQKETYGDQENPRCEQYVPGDNVDINIRSLHGNTSFHAMGSIKVVTPAPDQPEEEEMFKMSWRKVTPKDKKM